MALHVPKSLLLLGILSQAGCFGGGGGGGKPADGGTCEQGEETCACFPNQTCNAGLICASDLCVKLAGSSGSTATGSTDGASSSDGSTAGGTSAGSSSGGNGGSGASGMGSSGATGPSTGGAQSSTNTAGGGSAGSAGATTGSSASGSGDTTGASGGGSGGTATGESGGSAGATSGSGGSGTTTSGSGTAPQVIDDFGSCDADIPEIAGRSGRWYWFADTNVHLDFNVKIPDPSWMDHTTCAAIATGGALDPDISTGTTFAGIGVELAAGSAYDLGSYSGVTITIESGQRIWFFFKTSDGGYFGALVPGNGLRTTTIPFSSLAVGMASTSTHTTFDATERSLVTELQLTVETPSAGFGLAVHRLELE